jgi:hypothetical protein
MQPDISPDDRARQTGPSAAALAAAEREAFDVIVELSDLALAYGEALRGAAIHRDHLHTRLYALQLSRAVKTTLLTVDDIFTGRRAP